MIEANERDVHGGLLTTRGGGIRLSQEIEHRLTDGMRSQIITATQGHQMPQTPNYNSSALVMPPAQVSNKPKERVKTAVNTTHRLN